MDRSRRSRERQKAEYDHPLCGEGETRPASETGKHRRVIAQAAAYRYAEVEDMLKLAEEKGEPPFLFILDGIGGSAQTGCDHPYR